MQADLQAEVCRSRESKLAEEKKPRVSFGVILNESLAFEIYAEKIKLLDGVDGVCEESQSRIKGQSKRLAQIYGVSPKTIRYERADCLHLEYMTCMYVG